MRVKPVCDRAAPGVTRNQAQHAVAITKPGHHPLSGPAPSAAPNTAPLCDTHLAGYSWAGTVLQQQARERHRHLSGILLHLRRICGLRGSHASGKCQPALSRHTRQARCLLSFPIAAFHTHPVPEPHPHPRPSRSTWSRWPAAALSAASQERRSETATQPCSSRSSSSSRAPSSSSGRGRHLQRDGAEGLVLLARLVALRVPRLVPDAAVHPAAGTGGRWRAAARQGPSAGQPAATGAAMHAWGRHAAAGIIFGVPILTGS